MASWKGVILAGGKGSRLYPLTSVVNKHLLPVYDKPMIYYPLATLMLGGIREFVVVSSPESVPQIRACLGDGSRWGIRFDYAEQTAPRGIADGLLAAEEQLTGHNVALILGDNIFYGTGLPGQIRQALTYDEGATIFGYTVEDARSFGVVELDARDQPIGLEEKPANPNSNLAVPGLYFYDLEMLEIARQLTPSARGELEITDLNRAYLAKGALRVFPLGRGTAWLDGGTHENLFAASQFINVMEQRTGLRIACPEEVAFRMGYITLEALEVLAGTDAAGSYGDHLMALAGRERAKTR